MINKPHKIVFLYILISLIWILASDYFISILAFTANTDSTVFQTAKGFFFVLFTGWLLQLAIKKQQRFLVHYGDQYKGLFYSNPNALWIYDLNTLKFLEVNDAAIRIYGYSRDEFKSMTILDIRPKEDSQRVKKSARSMPEDYHISGNWRHIKKNGEGLAVSITSHKIKFNNLDCAMVMALDITLRLKQEEQLKQAYNIERELREELERNIAIVKQSLESKQRLAEVVDRINNMVIITDSFGVITWVNPAFENFTGYQKMEVIGKTSGFLHGPKTDPETQFKIMEGIRNSDFVSFEILNYTKSGEEYWVDLSISAIYNEQKEIVRYISIQNIITERKIREEKIKEQNRILSKHSWTNSHAIRKPVASILGLVSLSKEMQEIEEIKEIHSLIELSSIELDEMVKQMGKEINSCESMMY